MPGNIVMLAYAHRITRRLDDKKCSGRGQHNFDEACSCWRLSIVGKLIHPHTCRTTRRKIVVCSVSCKPRCSIRRKHTTTHVRRDCTNISCVICLCMYITTHVCVYVSCVGVFVSCVECWIQLYIILLCVGACSSNNIIECV